MKKPVKSGILCLLSIIPAFGQWQLIDDFQRWKAGDIYTDETEIGWHASCDSGQDEYWLLPDPYDAGNITLYIQTPQFGEPTNVWAMKELPDGGIPPGETGSIYFRSLFSGSIPSWYIGTADKPIQYDPLTGEQISPGAWQDFNALVRLNPESMILEHRNGDRYIPTNPPIKPEANLWYEFVLMVENNWDSDTNPPTSTGVYRLYIQGPGIGDGNWTLIPVATDPKRDSAFFIRAPVDLDGIPQAIKWVMFATNQGPPGVPSHDPFLLDDFYFSHGTRLPSSDPPPPWTSCWQNLNEWSDVDTGSLMGWINVNHMPQIWSYSLNGWVYMLEPACDAPGAWGYFYKYTKDTPPI